MAVFNLLLRLLSSWVLYIDWGDRWGYHAIITITISLHHHARRGILQPLTVTTDTNKNDTKSVGGSVRSGSVLTHYPGHIMLQYRSDTGSSMIILLHVQARPSCRPSLPATQSTTEVLPASQYLNQWCYFLVC